MSRKLTKEEFIEKARAIHGDKYDYSKVEYVDRSTDVCITCPIHGDFWQKPRSHISNKCGCQECGKISKSSKRLNDQEDIIRRFMEVHGDTYDYTEVEYTGYHTDVKIRCKKHGVFEQTPNNHISQKQGCPECARLKRAQSKTLSHEEQVALIAERNPHVDVLGMIVDDKTPVSCRCRICEHRWEPVPFNLKRGEGCPRCAKRGFLSHNCGKLYVMVDDPEVPTLMKIGVSTQEGKRKDQVLKSAQKAGAVLSDLHIAKTWEGSTEDMLALESALHQAFSNCKVSFHTKFDGSNEFFYYRPEVFSMVEELLLKTVDTASTL